MSTKDKIILIGYNPLFYMPEGYSPGSSFDISSEDSISKLIQSIPQVNTSGILWISKHEQIQPVLIIEKAKQVKDHLQYWSQGEPEKWFKFFHRSYTYKGQQGYIVILQPDSTKSLERYKFANTYMATKRIDVSDCIIFYQPLNAVATVSEHYKKFCKSKLNTVNLALVDSDELLALQGDYTKLEESMFHEIGSYKVAPPSWHKIGEHCKNVIKKYIEDKS